MIRGSLSHTVFLLSFFCRCCQAISTLADVLAITELVEPRYAGCVRSADPDAVAIPSLARVQLDDEPAKVSTQESRLILWQSNQRLRQCKQ